MACLKIGYPQLRWFTIQHVQLLNTFSVDSLHSIAEKLRSTNILQNILPFCWYWLTEWYQLQLAISVSQSPGTYKIPIINGWEWLIMLSSQ
jgi:hypothetical protein